MALETLSLTSTQQTQHLFSVTESSHLMQVNSPEHGKFLSVTWILQRNLGKHDVPGPRKCLATPSAMTIQTDNPTGFTQLNHIIPVSGMLRCSTNRPQAIGNSPSRSSERPTTPQSKNSLPPCTEVSQDSSQCSSSHPLGHSGQVLAAPPANAHPHFGIGTARSIPTVCPEHIHLNGDSVPVPQS